MWHDQHPTSGAIDNSKSVSGRASGHPQSKTYSHGLSEHQWGSVRGKDVAITNEPSSPTCMKGSDSQYFSESGRTDSGFLSGANLECQSVEITSPSSSRRLDDPNTSMKLDSKLDSGVDVGLPEQFSSLSLKNTSLNDLNLSSKTQSHGYSSNRNIYSSVTSKSPPKSVVAPQTVVEQPHEQPNKNIQSLELYFQQDEDGDTQLHIAIIQSFLEVVYSLIQMVPNQCYLDILNDVCQTPLHLAVLTRQPKIVRYLVIAGANQYIQDCHGNTALHLACQNGDLNCVKALTEPIHVDENNGVNLQYTPYIQELPPRFEERNYDGQMCVHLAALGGYEDVLRHLIWCGANINVREGKGGRTPLHYAIEYGIHKVAKFLLHEEFVRFVELETPTYAGYTAYQLAACNGSPFTRDLADRGALANFVPQDDESDSDFSDDEMYGMRDNYFTSHRINGEPINISA
ncbi:hypothetical protein L9F63_000838 [Diploptera punctata]|uniref:NF-kappa-B inhibitor cactus n=1 Tax=Diploptera punctata TaxID=6984 RepID=A0AAD8ERZ4_DIPPU|nr:hypothetical protein L9F63_000838 [Diploptera punctata]